MSAKDKEWSEIKGAHSSVIAGWFNEMKAENAALTSELAAAKEDINKWKSSAAYEMRASELSEKNAALTARIREFDKSIDAEMRDPNGTI